MISAFDRTNLKTLRQDFDEAIRAVAQKHGISIAIGNISFSPEKATSRVTFLSRGDSGAATPKENVQQAEFKRYASSFGLKPGQFGATIKFGRDTYKLVGLKPRAPKRPVLAQSTTDGKIYILPESALAPLQSADHKELFGIKDAAPMGSDICSETNAYDLKTMKPIGKCTKPATSTRKLGFGNSTRFGRFCNDCAKLRDEAQNEMKAEARANRY